MTTPIKPVTGITAETWARMALDSGLVYRDWGEAGEAIVGATRGGNEFKIEPEFREMPADGAPGPVKGSQRIVRIVAGLTINVMELTTENIKLALPGATSIVDAATHDKITRNCQIDANSYLDNLTLVLQKNGTDELYALKIDNALCLNGLNWTAAENEEVVMPLEFTAHFDPAAMDVEPWEIFNPLESAIVYHAVSYIAGANGSIIGDQSQSIADGENAEPVFASPDALFQFVDWSDASTANPRQDLVVSGDITVTANFSLI